MSPFHLLFLLFLLVPVAEIYVMIKVGGLIGAIPAISLLVFAAVLGVLLLRTQGFITVRRMQESMARGELPAMALLEGVAVMVAGVLLLIPGFLTDAVGLLLLAPPLRRWAIRRALRKAVVTAHVPGGGQPPPEPPPHRHPRQESGRKGGRVIEGEFERKD